MCEKCLQIDNTIQRFRQIKRSISEHLTVEKAKQVIADLEVQRAALHSTRTIQVAAPFLATSSSSTTPGSPRTPFDPNQASANI
jgi:hypothetical protein